jgi:hypothetical protein
MKPVAARTTAPAIQSAIFDRRVASDRLDLATAAFRNAPAAGWDVSTGRDPEWFTSAAPRSTFCLLLRSVWTLCSELFPLNYGRTNCCLVRSRYI